MRGLTVCNTANADSPTANLLCAWFPTVGAITGSGGQLSTKYCRFRDVANDGYDAEIYTQNNARYYKPSDKRDYRHLALAIACHAIQTPHWYRRCLLSMASTVGLTCCDYALSRFAIAILIPIPRDSHCYQLLGEERCQAFPPDSTTNFKPYGLFQEWRIQCSIGSCSCGIWCDYRASYDQNDICRLQKTWVIFSDEINPSTGSLHTALLHLAAVTNLTLWADHWDFYNWFRPQGHGQTV